MVASLTIPSAAKPYEDALIDWCEFFSLVSTIFIFQSGVVFKVLNDRKYTSAFTTWFCRDAKYICADVSFASPDFGRCEDIVQGP